MFLMTTACHHSACLVKPSNATCEISHEDRFIINKSIGLQLYISFIEEGLDGV